MKHLTLLFIAGKLVAQALSITAPATVEAGTPVVVQVSAGAHPTGWAGLQWDLTWTGPVNAAPLNADSAVSLVTNKYAESAPKTGGGALHTVLIGADCNGTTCTGLGNSNNTSAKKVADVTIPTNAGPAGTLTFVLANPASTDPGGTALTPTVGPSITVSVTASPITANFCDVDKNGVVDGADVNLQLSWVLGTALPPAGMSGDRNKDGHVDVADTQLIVVAASGGKCNATQ